MERGKRMYSLSAVGDGSASSKIRKPTLSPQQIRLPSLHKLTSFSTTVKKETEADCDTDSRRQVPADADRVAEIAEHTIPESPEVYLHKEPEANRKQIQRQRMKARCKHHPGYRHRRTDNCIESVNYHVTEGYENMKAWIYENRHISLLLESLVKSESVPKSGFVCNSGLLVELGARGFNKQNSKNSEPYDNGNKFAVQKVGDVFYMCELQIEKATTEEAKPKDNDEAKKAKMKKKEKKQMEYAGIKFESCITTPRDGHQTSTTDEPLDPNLDFNIVYKAELGGHALIYKSKIEACFPNDSTKFIEIKATNKLNEISFAPPWYKKMKWWLQTYLAGIKDIVVGYLEVEGDKIYTKKLLTTKVDTIIDDSNAKMKDAMLKYIIKVLEFVQTREEIVDHSAFVFERQPGGTDFTCQKTPGAAFLPYWFVQNVFAKTAGNT